MLISEMVSCGAWARAGPTRAHMGPKGPCMNRPSVDLPCSSTRYAGTAELAYNDSSAEEHAFSKNAEDAQGLVGQATT